MPLHSFLFRDYLDAYLLGCRLLMPRRRLSTTLIDASFLDVSVDRRAASDSSI